MQHPRPARGSPGAQRLGLEIVRVGRRVGGAGDGADRQPQARGGRVFGQPFAVPRGIEVLDRRAQPADQALAHGGQLCLAGEHHEVGRADLAHEVLLAAGLAGGIGHHQRRGADDVIPGDEAVDFAEMVEPDDADDDGAPAAALEHRVDALVDQLALGQPGDRVGQRFHPRAVEGIADAQAQLLDVKRLGNIVVGAGVQAPHALLGG